MPSNVVNSNSSCEQTSDFQAAIDVVEALPLDAQAALVEIIQQRLQRQCRDELKQAVLESEQEYEERRVHRGTVADLMMELDNE